MPMDIELQNIKDPKKRITVLYHHWENVLEPQGQWEPVQEQKKSTTPYNMKRKNK